MSRHLLIITAEVEVDEDSILSDGATAEEWEELSSEGRNETIQSTLLAGGGDWNDILSDEPTIQVFHLTDE